MSWSAIGLVGNVGSTAATTTTAIPTAIALSSGNVVVVTAAIVNPTSANATSSIVSTVNDSAGNTWLKAQEFQSGGGAAASGAICSIWYSQLTSALSSGGTITISHNNAAASTRRAAGAFAFSIAAGNRVSVNGTTWIAASSAQDPLSIDMGLSSAEHLRFRGIASESTLTTALSTTAGWTNIGTTRASAAAAMSYRGEYRITASTTAASNPVFTSTAADASVYVAFFENPPPGAGSAAGDASVAGIGALRIGRAGAAQGDGYAGVAGPFDLGAFE